MNVRGFMPFSINAYDNPETIRARKYATGAHLLARGIEVGRTFKEVVWEKGRASLYRYEPDAEIKFPVPIVLVYALILRPYVLDLVPGNSLVEYLKKEGFDVYLLEWGVPTAEDSSLSLEDYVLDYMPEALDRIRETSGAEGATLFGYCQGGTMATLHAALSPNPPTNLVLLATPTDFAPDDPGFFGLWTLWSRQGYFDPDLLVGPSGNVPADAVGRLIEGAARAPVVSYPGIHAGSWARLARGTPAGSFLAMSKWVDDGVPFPGAAFRQWIRDFYHQNRLVRSELELRRRRVDLSNISCPVLNIAGSRDYICPVSQARATTNLVSSEDKEFLVLDAGHAGLMGSPLARNKLWPRIRDWLGPRSG